MAEDIFKAFLHANAETESPAVYYRWCLLSSIGSMLGKQVHFNFGHGKVYPNLYTMLVGTPGARKSTPIKLCKRLLKLSGYQTIAADKTSKEKFLVDLAGESEDQQKDPADILDQNLFGDDSIAPMVNYKEVFIMADEANDFFGQGNLEFLSLLGNLWDCDELFQYRIKTGKSLNIQRPCVSILSANTPTGFATAFPPEVMGQGFFSRLLLVHGEASGRKYAFPKGLSDEDVGFFVEYLQAIRGHSMGEIGLTSGARKLLEKIYQSFRPIDDTRFEFYSTRRFSHLLKICVIYAATRFSTEISEHDVICANTVLSQAELYMPKALGEFGKAKHSDISHKIITAVESATEDGGIDIKKLWTVVVKDLEKINDLVTLVNNLITADKMQQVIVDGKQVFLPKKRIAHQVDSSLLDLSILTEEEKGMAL